MLIRITKRIKDRSGFSLAEMLMVVIIVLLVTAVVAAGIPVAVRAYDKVVDSANAQTLLSTAMTRLREELGTARIIEEETSEAAVTYYNSLGTKSQIRLQEITTTVGEKEVKYSVIYIQEYMNMGLDAEYPAHPLVTDSASSKKLFVTYDSIEYDPSNQNVILFHGLKVCYKNDSSKELVKLDLGKDEDEKDYGYGIRLLMNKSS